MAVLCLSSGNIRLIQNRLKTATRNFLNTLNQGDCVNMILNQTICEQYISSSLIGRVVPIGTFDNTELAVEYLYGLTCALPGSSPRDLTLNYRKKLVIFGMLAFDRKSKICGYEAVLQNPGLTFDLPTSFHRPAIENLCQGKQIICPVESPYKQYGNVTECIQFLSTKKIIFGTYDRADQNTVVCRLLHIQLAPLAPQVNCPHVGKTGGGACMNRTIHYYFTGRSDFVQCAHQYRR